MDVQNGNTIEILQGLHKNKNASMNFSTWDFFPPSYSQIKGWFFLNFSVRNEAVSIIAELIWSLSKDQLWSESDEFSVNVCEACRTTWRGARFSTAERCSGSVYLAAWGRFSSPRFLLTRFQVVECDRNPLSSAQTRCFTSKTASYIPPSEAGSASIWVQSTC